MPLIQNTFLQVPLQQLTEVYYEQVVPRLTKKNKVIVITAAIFLLVSSKLNALLRPPRKLRHIPHQGFFSYLVSLTADDSILKQSQRYALPTVNSKENNGLYLVYMFIYW
jgi:hypothetical protein